MHVTILSFHSTVPDQVSGVIFVSSTIENTLSMEWSRPQSDTPILYYEIRYRLHAGRRTWQGPIRATTEMVTIQSSLVPLNSYGVQVRAVSAIGAGPYSREVVLEGLFQCTYPCVHAFNMHTNAHTHTNNGCAISTLGHVVHVQLCLVLT